MNLDSAITEPFYRFHSFCEEFDRNMRVTYGGLQVLRMSSSGELNKPEDQVAVPSGDEPWGKTRNWRNIPELTASSTRFLSHMGLVRVTSAFEDFLGDVSTERNRFAALENGGEQVAASNVPEVENEEKLMSLCRRFDWNMTPVASILPLLEYFTLARNCVAHRAGRASRALVEFAENTSFTECAKAWRSARGKALPAFPKLEVNREIAILPRHAVLASMVYYRLALFLNERLLHFLGEVGVVYTAAYHGLLSEDLLLTLTTNATTADAVVNRVMFERFRVTQFTPLDTIRILKQLNKWRPCLLRFEAIQRKL